MSSAEIAHTLHCSPQMAFKCIEMARNFCCVKPYMAAMDTFNGVVFRALDAQSLSPIALQRYYDKVRIVSSVYGLLRPTDAIMPYRMEFNAHIPAINDSLKKYWRPRVTSALEKRLKTNPGESIILILPSDATACIDIKQLRAVGHIVIIDLKTYTDDGKLITPRAERLKNRRGRLLRLLLEQDIDTADQIPLLQSDEFQFIGEQPYPGHYMFIC